VRHGGRWLRRRRRRGSLPATAYLCSFQKTGRTWLRFLIANYVVRVLDLGLEVDFRTVFQVVPNADDNPDRGLPAYAFGADPRVPLVVCSHARYDSRFAGKPILTIVRSPLDTLVSFYLHRSKQLGRETGTLHEWLRGERTGVAQLVSYYDSWAPPLRTERSLVLSYERLGAAPETELAPVWPFLGLPEDAGAAAEAVERSRFDRLRRLEEQTQLPGIDYDVAEEDARRVRRGVVGGWRDYLDEEGAEYVRARLRRELGDDAKALLAPFWGDVL
jgi:alcohol sulfotransferase